MTIEQNTRERAVRENTQEICRQSPSEVFRDYQSEHACEGN